MKYMKEKFDFIKELLNKKKPVESQICKHETFYMEIGIHSYCKCPKCRNKNDRALSS